MSYWEDRAKEIIDEESKSDYEIAQEIRAAKAHVESRKEEFFAAVERLHSQIPGYAN